MTTINKRISLTAAALVLAALPAFAQQSGLREAISSAPAAQPSEGIELTANQAGATKFADRIAAVVNNDVITEYELQNPYNPKLPTWNGEPWMQDMLERKQELQNVLVLF